jgi:hypothetical protein
MELKQKSALVFWLPYFSVGVAIICLSAYEYHTGLRAAARTEGAGMRTVSTDEAYYTFLTGSIVAAASLALMAADILRNKGSNSASHD